MGVAGDSGCKKDGKASRKYSKKDHVDMYNKVKKSQATEGCVIEKRSMPLACHTDELLRIRSRKTEFLQKDIEIRTSLGDTENTRCSQQTEQKTVDFATNNTGVEKCDSMKNVTEQNNSKSGNEALFVGTCGKSLSKIPMENFCDNHTNYSCDDGSCNLTWSDNRAVEHQESFLTVPSASLDSFCSHMKESSLRSLPTTTPSSLEEVQSLLHTSWPTNFNKSLNHSNKNVHNHLLKMIFTVLPPELLTQISKALLETISKSCGGSFGKELSALCSEEIQKRSPLQNEKTDMNEFESQSKKSILDAEEERKVFCSDVVVTEELQNFCISLETEQDSCIADVLAQEDRETNPASDAFKEDNLKQCFSEKELMRCCEAERDACITDMCDAEQSTCTVEMSGLQKDDVTAELFETQKDNFTAELFETQKNDFTAEMCDTQKNAGTAELFETQKDNFIAELFETQKNDFTAELFESQKNDSTAEMCDTQKNDGTAELCETQEDNFTAAICDIHKDACTVETVVHEIMELVLTAATKPDKHGTIRIVNGVNLIGLTADSCSADHLVEETIESAVDSTLVAKQQTWNSGEPPVVKERRQSAMARYKYKVKQMSGHSAGAAGGFSGGDEKSKQGNGNGWKKSGDDSKANDNEEGNSEKKRDEDPMNRNQIDEMNSLKAKTSNLPGQDKPVVDQKTNWKEFRKKHGKLPDGHLIEFLGHLGSLDPEQVSWHQTELDGRLKDFEEVNMCMELCVKEFGTLKDDMACEICLLLTQMLNHFTYCQVIKFYQVNGFCSICTQTFNLLQFHLAHCRQRFSETQHICSLDVCAGICQSLKYSQLLSLKKIVHKWKKYLDRLKNYRENSFRDQDMPPEVVSRPRSGMVPSSLSRIDESPNSSGSLTIQCMSSEPGRNTEAALKPILKPENSDQSEKTEIKGETRVRKISFDPLPKEEPYHEKLKRKISPMPRTSTASLEYFSNASSNSESNEDSLELSGRLTHAISLPVGQRMLQREGYQHYSLIDRRVGEPGIGEVVYGDHHQLKEAAQYWAGLKHKYEDNVDRPRHLREEGVILKENKRSLLIGSTRYQKKVQWLRLSHLGNGTSGKCHLAVDQSTDFKFCVKRINIRQFELTELKIWCELKHRNIVKLYGALRLGAKIYILCEFIDGGCLTECINRERQMNRRISHWMAMSYFKQLLEVLVYLESKGILHEDLKADNILLRHENETTEIVVADFGLAHRINRDSEMRGSSPIGTQTQWSPEKAESKGHSFPSDLWSGICVLVHMFSGYPTWIRRYPEARMLHMIISENSPPMKDVPNNVQAEVVELIKQGFIVDPAERPSAAVLLKHPAFRILEQKPGSQFSMMAFSTNQMLSNKLELNDSEFESISQALNDRRANKQSIYPSLATQQLLPNHPCRTPTGQINYTFPEQTLPTHLDHTLPIDTSEIHPTLPDQKLFTNAIAAPPNSYGMMVPPAIPWDQEAAPISMYKTISESRKDNKTCIQHYLDDEELLFGVYGAIQPPIYKPEERDITRHYMAGSGLASYGKYNQSEIALPKFGELIPEREEEIVEKEWSEDNNEFSKKQSNCNPVNASNNPGRNSPDHIDDLQHGTPLNEGHNAQVLNQNEFSDMLVVSAPPTDRTYTYELAEDFDEDDMFGYGNANKLKNAQNIDRVKERETVSNNPPDQEYQTIDAETLFGNQGHVMEPVGAPHIADTRTMTSVQLSKTRIGDTPSTSPLYNSNTGLISPTNKHNHPDLHLNLDLTKSKKSHLPLLHRHSDAGLQDYHRPNQIKRETKSTALPLVTFKGFETSTGSGSSVFLSPQVSKSGSGDPPNYQNNPGGWLNPQHHVSGSSTPKSSSVMDKQEAEMNFLMQQQQLTEHMSSTIDIQSFKEPDYNQNFVCDIDKSISYVMSEYMLDEETELKGTLVTVRESKSDTKIQVRYSGSDLHRTWRHILDSDLLPKILSGWKEYSRTQFNLRHRNGVLLDLDECIPSQDVDLEITTSNANDAWWTERGLIM